MTFVRAAFAFVLLTPVIGLIGSRYLVTSMLAQNPETAMAPISHRPAATRTPSPVPTARPTSAPSATARPSPTMGLTPTIVLLMSTPRPTRVAPTPAPRPTAAPRPTVHRPAPVHHRPAPVRHIPAPVRHLPAPVRHLPAPSARRAHRHAVPTARPARPTPLPTARPTAVPTPGTVVLVRYWIGTTTARRGSTIEVGYVIDNGTGRTKRVMLGASIKSGSVLSWLSSISDPAHDVIATVPPGLSTHIRYFTLSTSLRPGTYDVAWGLRDEPSGRRDAVVAAPEALIVRR